MYTSAQHDARAIRPLSVRRRRLPRLSLQTSKHLLLASFARPPDHRLEGNSQEQSGFNAKARSPRIPLSWHLYKHALFSRHRHVSPRADLLSAAHGVRSGL